MRFSVTCSVCVHCRSALYCQKLSELGSEFSMYVGSACGGGFGSKIKSGGGSRGSQGTAVRPEP
jgi:hypothetical protein